MRYAIFGAAFLIAVSAFILEFSRGWQTGCDAEPLPWLGCNATSTAPSIATNPQ